MFLLNFSFFLEFTCRTCGKGYKVARSLWRHQKYECQKAPSFRCALCNYSAFHKRSVTKHMATVHIDKHFWNLNI